MLLIVSLVIFGGFVGAVCVAFGQQQLRPWAQKRQLSVARARTTLFLVVFQLEQMPRAHTHTAGVRLLDACQRQRQRKRTMISPSSEDKMLEKEGECVTLKRKKKVKRSGDRG